MWRFYVERGNSSADWLKPIVGEWQAQSALSARIHVLRCKKLSGRERWRIRVGRYRVIYEIDDAIRLVVVLDIGHRRDVYL